MNELEYQLNAIRGLLIFHHSVLRLILHDPLIFEKNPALKKEITKALSLAEEHLKVLLVAHSETAQQLKESLSKDLLNLTPIDAVRFGEILQMLEELVNPPEANDKDEEGKDKPQK